ncbi:MAG: EamA family transporter [Dermatophilaceae bacterium]
MTTPAPTPGRTRALLLVLAAVVSVQFGGAIAATLVPQIGAAGSVALRLGIGVAVLWAVARPSLRGHSCRAWVTVVLFGMALGAMNLTFYASLAHLPIGVAVTIEFIGPLTLAAVLSRRGADALAVVAAAVGIALISGASHLDWSALPLTGILLALAAGTFWAAYIVLSSRTGAAFPGVDGLAVAMLVAALLIGPWGVATAGRWSGEIALKGVAIAILSSVIPYSCELVALRVLSPQVFGILLSLEPAVAALAGFVVLGQRLTPIQVGGMGLVVVASALVMGHRTSSGPIIDAT